MTDNDTTPTSDDAEVRTRTRTRSRRSSATERPAGDSPATDAPQPAASSDDETAAGGGGDDQPVRRKTRSRRAKPADATAADAGAAPVKDAAAAQDTPAAKDTAPAKDTPADSDGGADAGSASGGGDQAVQEGDADQGGDASDENGDGSTTRRRRRGGRGRGRRGGRGRTRTEDETAEPDGDDAAAVEDGASTPAAASADSDESQPTRLQARGRGGRTAARTSGRGRARSNGASGRQRRPLGGVSEETRRAINEGPPRRMLVTVGEERTQIAVLEERTLVEHYVTRKEDVSYVGNIYLGRVQNVLPGMEAAFVDIGKGRNGVLYAGEVNYDEADLEEGDLPRIEQTLKSGQTVLVQVTKDPMGTKGARLTQQLSVAGRYCVLAAGDGMLGISRKLTDDERERLRKILKGLRPEGYGLIVRTAAEGATREQLEADIARLVRIWDDINARAGDAKALDSVYEEPHLVMRVIRDVFGTEYSELIVDSETLADQIRDYLSDVSPDFVEKVKVHTGDDHIFDAYEVTNQIRRALEKKVWLKSGGYLIIEKTEAMWVIDVNTGKFVGERNLEETVLRNNLEAADEIARQLRLRDMGGIIVIDFVDMLVPANRDEVLKRFRRELARDKTKSRVMEISKLGLVQMTRKNVSQGLQESFTEPCDVCDGRGAKIVEHMLH